MEKAKKVERGVGFVVGYAVDAYRVGFDRALAMTERNARFAREWFKAASREVRHQVEANRAMTRELFERAGKQRGAFQTLVEESVDAYMDLAYAPLAYYKRGLAVAGEATPNGEAPIAGYDRLNVEQVKGRVEGLSAAQIRQLRDYEKKHKNRETLIEQFDRKLRATSA